MSEIENAAAGADEVVQPEAKPEKPPRKPLMQRIFPWWVTQPKPEKVKKPAKQELVEWIITLLVAVVIFFLARSFVFALVRVDGDSMYPTLHHGEYMYVSKLEYGTSFIGVPFTGAGAHFTVGGNPERFDVVVCNYPGRLDEHGAPVNFVKRVVGLPGDTVEIRSGTLYVNGVQYPEKFLHQEMYSAFEAYTVPAKGDVIEIRGGQVYLNGVAQAQQAQYLSVILHERMGHCDSYTLPETGDQFQHAGQQLRVNGRASNTWASVLLGAWEGLSHTVEQDHFFLMGDNRNNSNDSRNAVVGAAPRDMIVGQVEGVIWHDIPSTLEDAGMKP